MKRALWILTIAIGLGSTAAFSESILSGLLMLCLTLSVCPLFWKLLDKKIHVRKLFKIILPVVLFFVVGITLPSDSETISEPIIKSNEPVNSVELVSKDVEELSGAVKILESEQSATILNTEIKELSSQDVSDTLDDLQVSFIDCGQADATLIKCGDNAMLIDSGENAQGTAIQLFLQRNEVKKLDYIIGTHLDSDHIGGMDVILTKFDCDTIILPDLEKDTATFRDVIDTMSYRNYKNTKPIVGKTYQLGDAKFTIISPNKEYQQDDHNNWSIGIKLEHGNNSFLFTGDAEEESESDILSNGIYISADIYKVAHHGSNTSTTDELLNTINPAYAVISCGKDNAYGHPHVETLDKLKAKSIKVFRTDEQGTIVATSDGENITWNCEPSDTWAAGEFVPVIETTLAEETQKPTEAPDAISYVLNTSSKKFHFTTCNGLPTKNRKDTNISREEIIAKGYVPCKRCNP